MNRQVNRLSANPVVQVLWFLVAGFALIAAVIMGAVILAFLLGFAVIVGIVVWVRIWWLGRKLARQQAPGRDPDPGEGGGKVIEVEYTVVDERDRTRQDR